MRLAARRQVNHRVFLLDCSEILAVNPDLRTLQSRAQPVSHDQLPTRWFRDQGPAVMRVIRNAELDRTGIALCGGYLRVLISHVFVQSRKGVSGIAVEYFRETVRIMSNSAIVTICRRRQQQRYVVAAAEVGVRIRAALHSQVPPQVPAVVSVSRLRSQAPRIVVRTSGDPIPTSRELEWKLPEFLLDPVGRLPHVEFLLGGRDLAVSPHIIKFAIPSHFRALIHQARPHHGPGGELRSGCMCVQPWLSISSTP